MAMRRGTGRVLLGSRRCGQIQRLSPAGKGVIAEFNVPTKSLFPAGKPEWSVIPGPNVNTSGYGPPPSQMPSATCIVVVCRR